MWKRSVCVVVGLVLLSAIPAVPVSSHDRQPGHYLNSFLIQTDSIDTAKRVARDNGFQYVEQIDQLDLHLLSHPAVTERTKRSADDFVDKLKQDNRVSLVEQQVTLQRDKRTHEVVHDKQLEFPIKRIMDNSKYYRNLAKFDNRDIDTPMFNDQYFTDQWVLLNEEQTGGKRGIDLNVVQAWQQGFTGEGIIVSTLDDGLDHNHPDIRNNYDPEASADFNDRDDAENDPAPGPNDEADSHGTRCAGEIAAEANNGICGVGVAYKAKIGGIRILAGGVTDELEAKALLYHNQHIDIYSASWGPRDAGATMEGPKAACKKALRKGVQTGRGGKGSIYVWATGNGGLNDDMCGADGYVSGVESISVQSLSDHGNLPFFGERCASTMVSVPSGGEPTREEELDAQYKIKVVTIDLNDRCMENFEGTSSACPLAAGVYALVLQANPDLGWRDVQHITAQAARISFDDSMWVINGAGYHVNEKFGFGMMDASQMVKLAQTWENKPPQHICEIELQEEHKTIGESSCYRTKIYFDGCKGDSEQSITHLEHTEIDLVAKSGRRGNVEIYLESPAGTRSRLLGARSNDDTDEEIDFTFMTVHNWMENPEGEWVVEICDAPNNDTNTHNNNILLKSWRLRVYGYHDEKRGSDNHQKSKNVRGKDVEEIMEKEFHSSRSVGIKRATISKKGLTKMNKKLNINNVSDRFSKKSQKLDFRSLNFDSLESRSNLDKETYDELLTREIDSVLEELEKKDNSYREVIENYFAYEKKLKEKRKLEALVKDLSEYIDRRKLKEV